MLKTTDFSSYIILFYLYAYATHSSRTYNVNLTLPATPSITLLYVGDYYQKST